MLTLIKTSWCLLNSTQKLPFTSIKPIAESQWLTELPNVALKQECGGFFLCSRQQIYSNETDNSLKVFVAKLFWGQETDNSIQLGHCLLVSEAAARPPVKSAGRAGGGRPAGRGKLSASVGSLAADVRTLLDNRHPLRFGSAGKLNAKLNLVRRWREAGGEQQLWRRWRLNTEQLRVRYHLHGHCRSISISRKNPFPSFLTQSDYHNNLKSKENSSLKLWLGFSHMLN